MDDILDVLRKLVPVLGEDHVRNIWERMQLADPKIRKILELQARRTLADQTGYPFRDKVLLDPIPADRAHGQFRLGQVRYASDLLHVFGLRPDELIQHAAVFGRSGAGKTNTCFLLLRELARNQVPFLVFDWKRNYRDLLTCRGFENLTVYTVGRDPAPFFFNPLIPPGGIEPRTWLKKLIEIMRHAYFLGDGVAFLLQDTLDQVYRDFGVYRGSGTWPTFRDLLAVLESRRVKGREASWMESTLRAARVLTFGDLDWVLNSGAHLPVKELLNQQAVLELEALDNTDKTFLIEALLLWIHRHRMQERERETLKHVLVVEEAHHILLGKKQQATGSEQVTDLILREIREFGEAIVLLDQVPSLISKPALENTFTTIAMNLKERADVTAASGAMLLTAEQTKHLGHLPVGSGIVKLQSRWTRPFLVTFPHFPVSKGQVTDADVSRRYSDSVGVETAAKLPHDATQSIARQVHRTLPSKPRHDRHTTEDTPLRPVPTPNELALLKDVHEHPVSTVTERYRRLLLPPERGTRLVNRLKEKNLLTATRIPVPGSSVVMLTLTPSGSRALSLPDHDIKRYGGPHHRYWVEVISRELSALGITVQKEAPLGGGTAADLLVTKKDKRIAVEVETGKSDWQANVAKHVAAGVHSVVIAATSSKLAHEIATRARRQSWSSTCSVVAAHEAARHVRNLLQRQNETASSA